MWRVPWSTPGGTKLVLVLLCKEHWLSELSSLGTGVLTFLGRGVYLSRPVRSVYLLREKAWKDSLPWEFKYLYKFKMIAHKLWSKNHIEFYYMVSSEQLSWLQLTRIICSFGFLPAKEMVKLPLIWSSWCLSCSSSSNSPMHSSSAILECPFLLSVV